MGRLVDADDLEKGLEALIQRKGIKCWLSTAFDAADFESLIDDAPTVDAEPVIRCKDCRYWDKTLRPPSGSQFCFCTMMFTVGSHYCARGSKVNMEESNAK